MKNDLNTKTNYENTLQLCRPVRKNMLVRISLLITVLLISITASFAQPPGHDPSRIIKDGSRYYIFCTGNGIWELSSSSAGFTNWQVETSPFVNGWPSWINNYVSGFSGFFWAPDIIYMNGQYYLYYACSMGQRPCAIGVATSPSLSNPSWTDHGMVVYSDNSTPYGSIDPDVFFDNNGRLWLVWGSHLMGIVLTELNPSTGKPYNVNNYYNLADSPTHDCEAPAIIYHSGYYYLFFNRYTCCAGVNSTYTIFMGRSTSVTGPYLDLTGNNCVSSGGSVFLNSSGRYIGPGQFGYGESRLTYHFYDGNDNGTPKINNTTLNWINGWPLPASNRVISGGTYRIIPRNSGKAIDVENCGTGNGTNIRQWSWLNNPCQQFILTDLNDGTWRITPSNATGEAVDLTNCSSAAGTNIDMWSWLNNACQRWKLNYAGSDYYQIQSDASGQCLNISGNSSADGANVIQWPCSSAYNMQFMFVRTKSAESLIPLKTTSGASAEIYPNPSDGNFIISTSGIKDNSIISLKIIDLMGNVIYEHSQRSSKEIDLNTDLVPGSYVLYLEHSDGVIMKKLVIK